MKIKRIKCLILGIVIILFVAASFVYYNKYWNYDRMTVDYRAYSNIANYDEFRNVIENELDFNFENSYIYEADIEVDSKGNILELLFTLNYYKNDGDIYYLQIELDKTGDYELRNAKRGEPFYMDSYVSMLKFIEIASIVDSFLFDEGNTIIMLQSDVPGDIKYNSIYEGYVVYGNDIIKIENDMIGRYLRTTLLNIVNGKTNSRTIYFEKD